MGGIVRKSGYSARTQLLAAFVVVALILGGGGSPNPWTEIALEIVFVAFALAWAWLPQRESSLGPTSSDRLALVLVAVPLVVPIVQLVPLPPSIWTGLPGRENAVAALSLVGQQATWRPISLSPSRTLASLLSIVPAVFCLYAVSRLNLSERRIIIGTVFVMAIVTALLGAVQVVSGGRGLNFYPQHHIGWVTGFQANRNATADILLSGFLALAALAAPHLVGGRRRHPLGLNNRALSVLAGATALFLLAATMMTGSRTGIALVLVAGTGALLLFFVTRDTSRFSTRRGSLVFAAAVVWAVLGVAFWALSDVTAASRVALRFADFETPRTEIWKDTWFALKQYWPAGFGLGGFEPAMLPAERLEVLVPQVPNRAHNDFLEIALEAGLLGCAMVGAALILCIVLAWRAWRAVPAMRGQVIFGLAVLLVVALHSIVDYPLRSMALACLSGVAAGMLVRYRVSADRQTALGADQDLKGLA